MANSITGINDDIIAQAALEAFTAALTPLSAFSTNFNSDAARRGDKVSILRTIAADAAVVKSSHTAYTIQDADSDSVEISLGQPYYVSWALDDVEIASSSVLNMEVYGRQKGFQLAKYVLQDATNGIWAKITNANFGAAAFTGAASTFDSDDVADIKDACDDADMPEMGRSLILSNAYYTALLKDTSIKSSDAYGGTEAIRSGMIPNLMGFTVFASNLVPANGENLVGFACEPSCFAVGMRYLQPQEGNTYNRAEAFTNEAGMTLGLRDWYDNDTGERKRVLETVVGSVVGISAGLKRMVSA